MQRRSQNPVKHLEMERLSKMVNACHISSKYELMRTMGRGGVTSMRTFAYKFFLIKHPVQKLLTIVTDFLINSSKYVLLKLSVLKNYISFVLKITNQ